MLCACAIAAADVETLADLVSFAKHDLLKFRNFGKKSLIELEDLVANKGIQAEDLQTRAIECENEFGGRETSGQLLNAAFPEIALAEVSANSICVPVNFPTFPFSINLCYQVRLG